MKKLNNKGFAITTLLYGLMSVGFLIMTLLMGIMSQNRQNTSTLVKKIEEELNRYGETETTFAYLGAAQEYIVPYGQAGWYKIELWGAEANGVLGDYTSGVIYLEENAKLYFYLGNTCANATACATAFNKGNTEVRTNTATETSTIMRASGYERTSYIAGHAGANSPTEAGVLSNKTDHFSTRYFLNGLTVKGVNESYGKANVELVSKSGSTQYPTMKHSKLSNVQYIKHCNGSGSTLNLVEIQAIDIRNGSNIIRTLASSRITGLSGTAGNAYDGKVNSNYATISNGGCVQINLGSKYNLSEIAIWHSYGSPTSYQKNTLLVSENGSSWKVLKDYTQSATSVISSELGEHYSAWQPDSTAELPSGRYYIFSISEPSQVITSQEVPAGTKASASFKLFAGSKIQKWTFERVSSYDTNIANKATYASTPIYRIYDSYNNYALQLQDGTNEEGEYINAATTPRNYEWDLWQLIPVNNGTYKIKSLIGGANRYVYQNTSGTVVSKSDVSGTNYNTRFRIVNAEY